MGDKGIGKQHGTSAARIVAGYVIVASAWILLSDRLLSLFPDKETMLAFSTLKGAFFVLVTSLCLFFLISGELKRRGELEVELRRRLEEKEVLVKELHHRVKNNLQILASFVSLERGLVDDERDRRAFDDMESRIQSMALVHEQLYLAGDLGSIDLGHYAEKLSAELAGIFGSRLLPALRLSSVSVGVDRALPFGLILAEELGEAMRGGNELSVRLEAEEGPRAVLELRRAAPAAEAGASGETADRRISWQIEEALAQQLGGTLSREEKGGELLFKLVFATSRQGS